MIITNPNGTCDIGLMQVNSATMDDYGLDNDMAASSYIYNIGAAAYILIKKWNDISSYYSHWEAVPLTLPPKESITNPPPTWIARPSPHHPDPHASTHLPNIRVNRYDYDDRSVITVRNVSGDYVAVNITIYDQNGGQVGSSDHTLTADASWTVNAFDIADGGIQYLSGSAVVAASPDVAVVVQNRTSTMITP